MTEKKQSVGTNKTGKITVTAANIFEVCSAALAKLNKISNEKKPEIYRTK
jgi:hypothetical protein